MKTAPFTTPEEYLAALPAERREVVAALREAIVAHLPEGFEESMSNGMITYAVPHSLYPDGYHCDPQQPLPFLSLASQKNYIALYHMGLYVDQDLLKWFQATYPQHSPRKLDMGKSCIRFKKPEHVPVTLIGELCSKMTPAQWIAHYERALKK